jgi:hypothetical protein
MSKHLHKTLTDLHAELVSASGDTLDVRTLAELETVLQDIKRALEKQQAHAPTTLERLESSAVAFELRHPRVAELARDVADAVRKAGI